MWACAFPGSLDATGLLGYSVFQRPGHHLVHPRETIGKPQLPGDSVNV